jgi:GH15 family glucan-1,4-alpha-glucosidase
MAKLGVLGKCGLVAACAGMVALFGGEARADNPLRTFNFLTTGNGYGFQYFDTNQNKIVAFLQHPYRYLGPNPTDPTQEGAIRRQLAFDFYFGLRGGWLNAPTQAGDPEYLDQSNIIHFPATLGSQQTDSYFFAPFGYPGNAMVAILHAPGASDAFVIFNFHMGTGDPDAPDANGESVSAVQPQQAVAETGPGGGTMVYVPLSGFKHQDCNNVYANVQAGQDLGDNTSCAGNDIVPGFQQSLDSNGWFAVAVLYDDDPTQAGADAQQILQWANGRTPDKILSDAQAEFESWRKPPPSTVALCTDDEQKLWRQSEAVLRMGQIQEPYLPNRKNTGMILASLPPGAWHTGWVRDAMYSIVALSRSGHFAEAKAALDFFLNAGPVSKYSSYVNNQQYLLSVVRYFGSGEEEADYSGQPTPNIEIDGWGMIFWAARAYVEASGDVAWLSSQTQNGQTVYQALIGGIAQPLEANIEQNGIVNADCSIWEVHEGNARHFAYTDMAAARGYCDLAALANKNGQTNDVSHYQQLSAKIKQTFLSAFVDPQGALGGSLEGLQQGVYFDGSVAEAFTWNILPDFTGANATATLNMFDNLKVGSGGFKRNNDGLSSYDDNEWILVDFRISEALRRNGRGTDADGYIAQIIQKAAANFYLLPELYNAVPSDGPIGNYTGSIPMVGYGGGAYIITMLDRSGLIEPNDCGDGNGVTLPSLTCSGITTGAGGGSGSGGTGGSGNGGTGGSGSGGTGGAGGTSGPGPDGGLGANGSNVPYTAACLCQLGVRAPSSVFALAAFPGVAFLLRRVQRRRRAR